jgi:hypothetical protein
LVKNICELHSLSVTAYLVLCMQGSREH